MVGPLWELDGSLMSVSGRTASGKSGVVSEPSDSMDGRTKPHARALRLGVAAQRWTWVGSIHVLDWVET